VNFGLFVFFMKMFGTKGGFSSKMLIVWELSQGIPFDSKLQILCRRKSPQTPVKIRLFTSLSVPAAAQISVSAFPLYCKDAGICGGTF